MVAYPAAYGFDFRAGPYTPPAVKVGATVHDEYYGDVMVEGTTNTPIPWPGFHCKRGRHKGLMPILFAGLVRAVAEEDEVAVAHSWGVTRYMVNEWKRASLAARTAMRSSRPWWSSAPTPRSARSTAIRRSDCGSGLLVHPGSLVRLLAFQVAAPSRPIPHPLSLIALRAA